MSTKEMTRIGTRFVGAGDVGNTNLTVTDRTINTLSIDSSTGNVIIVPNASTTLSGLMTGTDKSYLYNMSQKLSIDGNGNVAINGDTAFIASGSEGVAGEVLSSSGSGAQPAWEQIEVQSDISSSEAQSDWDNI